MSKNNPSVCANCGKPKAQEARRLPKWPTYWADMRYLMKSLGPLVTNDPVYVNGRRMGVPPIPAFLPARGLKVNPAAAETPKAPEDKPIYIGGRRMGVPPIPSFLPPKDAA